MLGILEPAQIDQLLYAEPIGRIGCHTGGRTYIIPVNYAYDGENIYGRSIVGMKLDMMRTNPEVCFQVDQVKNLSNWKSVIAWGTFQELVGDEAAAALHVLAQRITTLIASGQLLHEMSITGEPAPEIPKQRKITIYRIHLTEKTGRFETSE